MLNTLAVGGIWTLSSDFQYLKANLSTYCAAFL